MKRVLKHIWPILLASLLLLTCASCTDALDPADTDGTTASATEETTAGATEETTADATEGTTAGATEGTTAGETVGTVAEDTAEGSDPEATTADGAVTEPDGMTESTTDGTPETTPPQKDTEPETQPAVQEPLENLAPDFAMLDWNGDVVELSDLVGKPIVLNFWASWCPPCKAEMPDFEEAYKKYGDRVHFIMLNLTDGYSETIDTAKAHVNSSGYTFPVYFDVSGAGGYYYDVQAIPQTCFINSRGQLVSTSVGMIDGATLEAWIGRLLEN